MPMVADPQPTRMRLSVLPSMTGGLPASTITLEPPKAGEVLVEMTASGMCHSDDHARTGDLPAITPLIGGHEGAGIVLEVGEGVTSVAPGDHVVFSFVPSCGHCPSCADELTRTARASQPPEERP